VAGRIRAGSHQLLEVFDGFITGYRGLLGHIASVLHSAGTNITRAVPSQGTYPFAGNARRIV
jgi:hypothetical protein